MRQGLEIELLSGLPLFQGLSQDHLRLFAFSAERISCLEGDILTHAGQVGDGAYMIVSGKAEVRQGHEQNRRLKLAEPGAMIGELAMLIEYSYASEVVMMEDSELLEFPRKTVHMLMREFPLFAEHFSHRIHARLSRMAEELRRVDRHFEELEKLPAAS